MKIALISDLHIDINKEYPVLEAVAAEAGDNQADLLVIAGDISENPKQTLSAMKQLQNMCSFPVYYVPGNHDLWNKFCPERTTEEIYDCYLKDESCLSGKAIILGEGNGELAVTGDVGWYDYSLAEPEYTREMLDAMSISGRTWQDHLYNQWTKDNASQMARSLEGLERQLKQCGEVPILVVTHMLSGRDFCVPVSQKDWGFFNAYLGSTALEQLYLQYPVRYAVCGHVHYRSQVERNGILHICPCLGYYNEWPLYQLEDNSVERHVRDAMYIIETGDETKNDRDNCQCNNHYMRQYYRQHFKEGNQTPVSAGFI